MKILITVDAYDDVVDAEDVCGLTESACIAIGSLVERPVESAYGAVVFLLAVGIWTIRRGKR